MKLFVIAALLALAAADQPYRQAYSAPAPYKAAPVYQPAPAYKPAYEKPQYEETGKPHSFEYAVKDAQTYADFAHVENSDGQTVNGEYRVNLPDGRTQIVSYKADDYGNVADVKYIGEAKYPEEKPYKAAPQYAAPAYNAPSYEAPKAYAPVPVYTPSNYKADDYGNVADVKYIGEAKYPEEKPYKAAPQYAAPAYKAPSYEAPKAYAAPTPIYKPKY